MKTILALMALALVAELFGGIETSPDTVHAIAFLPIALGAGALLSGASSIIQGNRANKLQKRALSLEEQDWRSREPARQAALQRLLGPMPTAPDLSAGFQDPGNPFAMVNRQAAPVAPAQTMPAAGMGRPASQAIPTAVLEQLLGMGGAPRQAQMRGMF